VGAPRDFLKEDSSREIPKAVWRDFPKELWKVKNRDSLREVQKAKKSTTDASTPWGRPGDAFAFFKASKPIKINQNI
jgi:hypothetical protein